MIVDLDGVITFPERVARLRYAGKKEVREFRIEWYSGGKIRMKVCRVSVLRLEPVKASPCSPALSAQMAVLERALSGMRNYPRFIPDGE